MNNTLGMNKPMMRRMVALVFCLMDRRDLTNNDQRSACQQPRRGGFFRQHRRDSAEQRDQRKGAQARLGCGTALTLQTNQQANGKAGDEARQVFELSSLQEVDSHGGGLLG